MALLEDCESIQLSLMHVVDGLVKGTLEPTRAKLIIQALRIAARNAKNVRFDDSLYQPTDPPMVRQVPDYARQYQIEHPADPCSPDAPVREALATSTDREPLAQPETTRQSVSMENAESPVAEAAARRRNNPAHSASCRSKAKIDPAPKERKKPTDDENPLSASESKEYERINQAEAAIADALQGNWRTVFEFAGITPPSRDAPS